VGPADLARLDYIQYKSDPDEKHLAFADGSLAPITVSFAAQMPDLMLHAVQNHLGIATLPRFFVQEHLASGALAEVLPGHQVASKQMFLLRAPGTNAKGRRVAIFTERLMTELAAMPGFRVAA
jgi:DNA-binding transcriptional LysR family regulator